MELVEYRTQYFSKAVQTDSFFRYKVLFFPLSHIPPKDNSVNLTQSSGQMNPHIAFVLLASSPALPLSALKAKCVVHKGGVPLGSPP